MYWDGPSTIVPGGQSLCGGLRVFLTWQLHCPDGHSNNSRKRVAFLVLYVFFTVCVMRVISSQHRVHGKSFSSPVLWLTRYCRQKYQWSLNRTRSHASLNAWPATVFSPPFLCVYLVQTVNMFYPRPLTLGCIMDWGEGRGRAVKMRFLPHKKTQRILDVT